MEAPFIGLQDFTQEGTFSWGNGMALGGYTNWLSGNNQQPDNGVPNGDAAAMGNQVMDTLLFCQKPDCFVSSTAW